MSIRPAGGERELRTAFIVGAPRCGTTFLAKVLAGHPAVCFSKPKETHFFARVAPHLAPGARRDEFLRRHFAHLAPAHRLLADGSPSTLYEPDAGRAILAFDPEARFVIAVRDPVEMIASYHARLLFTLDEDEPDLATAWALQERRMRGEGLPRRCRDPRLLQYRVAGSLGAQVEAFLAAVGAERCRVVVFDDLLADPRKAYCDLLDFLGLPDDGRTVFRRANENRVHRRAWAQTFVMNPPRPVGSLLAVWERRGLRRPRAIRALRRRLKKWNTRKVARTPLTPALRATLEAAFAADVRRLEAVLARDLSAWRAKPITGPRPGTDATKVRPAGGARG